MKLHKLNQLSNSKFSYKLYQVSLGISRFFAFPIFLLTLQKYVKQVDKGYVWDCCIHNILENIYCFVNGKSISIREELQMKAQ